MSYVNSSEKILPNPAVSSTSLGQIGYETTYNGGAKRKSRFMKTRTSRVRLNKRVSKRRVSMRRINKKRNNGSNNCWWKFF